MSRAFHRGDDSLNDHGIIGGVIETEHDEIAVYDGLITEAEAMGVDITKPASHAALRDTGRWS